MLELRKEYKGKSIFFNPTRTTLILDDLDKKTYKFYSDNGLDYLFVEVKSVKPKMVKYKGTKKDD